MDITLYKVENVVFTATTACFNTVKRKTTRRGKRGVYVPVQMKYLRNKKLKA